MSNQNKTEVDEPKEIWWGGLDLMSNVSEYPTIAVLEGSDCSVSHAVGIVGNWLFDSNLTNAQPISKDILNWCVSSEESCQTFVGVYSAVRFEKQDNDKKNVWNVKG